jgi:hypothetical protein
MHRAGASERKLFRYPGLKEDYYLSDFQPDPAVLDGLGIDPSSVLVVFRPSPETSAYHAENPLEGRLLDRVANAEGVTCVVIPRTDAQGQSARARGASSIIVSERAVDAQSLIALADLVVSAGGTMNREAVALGTPAYTIFSGRRGAVDERLIAEGRLIPLHEPGELRLTKREPAHGALHPRDPELLVDAILEAIHG